MQYPMLEENKKNSKEIGDLQYSPITASDEAYRENGDNKVVVLLTEKIDNMRIDAQCFSKTSTSWLI